MVTIPAINVRKIKPKVNEEIRVLAAKHDRSMEAEVRDVLVTYVCPHQSSPKQIASRVHRRFAKLDRVDELNMSAREAAQEPIIIDE